MTSELKMPLSAKLRRIFGIKRSPLEMITRACWNCEKQRIYIYLGNYGTKYNPKFTYECNHCGVHYVTSKRLKKEK